MFKENEKSWEDRLQDVEAQELSAMRQLPVVNFIDFSSKLSNKFPLFFSQSENDKGVSHTILGDTGASISLLSINSASRYGVAKMLKKPITIKLALEGPGYVIDQAIDIWVAINPRSKKKLIRFYVCKDVHTDLMGLYDMGALGIMLRIPMGVGERQDNAPHREPLLRVVNPSKGIHPEFYKTVEVLLDENAKCSGICSHPNALYKLKIDEGAEIKYLPEYALPDALIPEIAVQVNDMIKEGIIVEIQGPKRIVLNIVPVVTHKENKRKVRLCLNMIPVNKLIPEHHFKPVLSIHKLLMKCAGHSIFTKLDLSKAFHSCPVDERTSEYLVFKFLNGFYSYKRAVFGLSDLPNHFMKLMTLILSKFADTLVCYIDDILIFSNDAIEHERVVKEVILLLSSYKLIINREKSVFATNDVIMLGHRLCDGKISIDPLKAVVVRNFPKPITLTELRGFLGSVVFLQGFVPGIVKYMVHLYALTANLKSSDKKQKVVWGEKSNLAFVVIKKLLNEVIATTSFPSVDTKRVIYTDASEHGIAAIIGFHDIEGNFVPVEVFQTTYKEYERNYSAVKKETLAVFYAIKRFHNYVYGLKFTVFVDCKSLSFVYDGTSSDRALRDWFTMLSCYNFDIVHVNGVLDNWLADRLSRPEENVDDELVLVDSGVDELTLSAHFAKLNFNIQSTVLKKEEVFAISTTNANNESLKQQMNWLFDMHGKSGHGGADVMVRALKAKGIEWTNMDHHARVFAASCIICLGFNAYKRGYRPMSALSADSVWDIVIIDLSGPRVTSAKGNNYICSVIDVLSGYLIMMPIVSKEATVVADCLFKVFCWWGAPRMIQSDNGTEFVNKVVEQLTKKFGIIHRLGPPYTPRAQGKVERNAGVAKNYFSKIV